MTAYSMGYLFGQLFLMLLFVLPAILFLVAQQRMLQVIRPEYRELRPGLVWLQLIPVFNHYWMFVVVTRIADSISKELVARQDDSILGIPDFDAVQAVSHRPTYRIGMAWCLLFLCWPAVVVLVNLTATKSAETFFGAVVFLMGMVSVAVATLVCWIIYWVRLAQNKRKLERFQY